LLLLCSFLFFQDIDQYRHDQYDTCDDLLPVCLKADIGKTSLQKHDDKDTYKRTEYGTISSGSGNAAHEYAADGVHFQAGSRTGLYGRSNCRICDCCKSCEKTAYYIYHYVIELHVDSGKSCRLFIGADSNCVTSELRMEKDEFHQENQNDHPQETNGITVCASSCSYCNLEDGMEPSAFLCQSRPWCGTAERARASGDHTGTKRCQ